MMKALFSRACSSLGVTAALCLLAACGEAPPEQRNASIDPVKAERMIARQTVVIGTSDGKKIFADHVPVAHARATIVLFHQAESSAQEYAEIAARLNAMGYSTLAVDQRSGGRMYGANRTVEQYGSSGENYVAALPDLVAALNWARLQGQPVILWGSSYSASLVLKAAAENPTLVAAVLSFSPGEYFEDKNFVRQAAAKVAVPVFVTQASTAEEVAEAKPIFDALPSNDKMFFEPKTQGVHGSSTLRADRNPKGAAENWQAVTAFLDGLGLSPS